MDILAELSAKLKYVEISQKKTMLLNQTLMEKNKLIMIFHIMEMNIINETKIFLIQKMWILKTKQ